MNRLSMDPHAAKMPRLVFVICFALCLLTPFYVQAQSASSTTLVSSSLTVQWPKPVTLTATVTSGTQRVYPGSVNFCVATAKACRGVALLGSSQLTVSGTASFTTVLGVGTHSVKAVFNGTSSVAVSASAALTVNVSGSNSTTMSISATGQAGNYTLAASVNGSAFVPPTGQVSFFDATNGINLGNTTLMTGSPVLNFRSSILAGTGSEPIPLASADFNGDGLPDIVVANLASGTSGPSYTLSVFLSTAVGTYTAPSIVNLNTIFYGIGAIATGDLNNDGFTDIVISGDPNVLVVLSGDGKGNFSPATSYLPTQYHPNAVAVADFNGDGNSDLAVTDQFANTVSIMLGNGHGSFTVVPGAPLATGYYPYAIAAGDFNGDGKPDLAIPNYFSNSVTVMLGNGSGGFASGVSLQTGVYPDAIVAMDLNGDGKLDLAVVNQFSKTVDIFLGNGSGGLAPPTAPGYQPPATGSSPSSIASSDFNGDGIADLAVGASGSGQIDILLGNGDGTFAVTQTFGVNSETGQMVATDVNGDGKADVLLAGPNTNSVIVGLNTSSSTSNGMISHVAVPGVVQQSVQGVYRGDGNDLPSASLPLTLVGTPVASTVTLSTDPSSVAAAGQPVQVTAVISPAISGAIPNGDQVIFFDGGTSLGSAKVTGTFATLNLAFPAGTHKLSARFQGDGTTFVPENSNSATLTSVVQIATTTALAVSSSSVARGTPVKLTATVTAGGTAVQHGLINFCSTKAVACTGSALLGSAALKANGTAALQLVLPIGVTSIKGVFPGALQNLSSTSTPLNVTVTGAYPTHTALAATGATGNYTLTATVNGSGPALGGSVSFTDTSNKNLVLGSSFFTPATLNSFVQSARVQFAPPGAVAILSDVNNDGKPDIIARGQNAMQVLLGNGDGTFRAPMNTSGAYRNLAVADFNGDGQPDIAALDANTFAVNILLGNGDGTFTFKSSTLAVFANASITVGDFDRDGIPDLAVGNLNRDTVTILLGKGDGTFAADPATISGLAPLSLATADFNADGKLDMAIVDVRGGLTIALGNGDGTFQISAASPALGSQPQQVKVGDFNGDGKPDLATNNLGSNDISILLGNGDGTFTASQVAIPNVVPFELAVADFNNDGFADLFVADGSGQNRHTILLGFNNGRFQQQPATGVSVASGVAAGDLNGDGFPDLVYAEGLTGFLDASLSTSVKTAELTGVRVYGAGNHQLIANYSGTSPYQPSTSTPVTVLGSQIASTIAVAAPLTAAPANTIQVTTTVFPKSLVNFAATGNVSLSTGNTILATQPLTNGQATFSVTLPATGALSLHAAYPGDANFASTASAAITVAVAQASTIKLSLSSNTVATGTPVSLTASVAAGGKPITQGLVTFCDTAALCEDSAIAGTAQMTATGTAALRIVPGIGMHSYRAIYASTGATSGSISALQNLTVTGLFPTTTSLTSTQNTSPGTYSLTASVRGASSLPPAGAISFVNLSNKNAVLGTAALGPATTTLSFSASAPMVMGSTPSALVSGDFNGDGKPDLAVADSTSNNVTILLGNGNGTLTPKSTIATGTNPTTLAVGDLDGNGRLDLVIASNISVSVLLGNGDGTFTAKPSITLASAYGIAVVDLNSDGKMDLVVSGALDRTVRTFLGNGDGTFKPGSTLTNPLDATTQIVTADFNGDGRADIAVGISNLDTLGGSWILLGNGDGAFTDAGTLSTNGFSLLAAADFNRDGRPDIAAVNQAGLLSVFLGNGDGSFGAPETTLLGSGLSSVNALEAADWNGDGSTDLAAIVNNQNVTVLTGSGDGKFSVRPATLPTSALISAFAIADFDTNGRPDIVTANQSVTVLLRSGPGNLSAQPANLSTGAGTSPSALADADTNGRLDTVAANQSASNVSVFLNDFGSTATATLSNVGAAANLNVQAQFPANTMYGASVSNALTLAPAP